MNLIDIEHGRTRAVIAPDAGGRLLQLAIRDGDSWLELLHAPDDPAEALRDPLAWSSYPMAPWPGRADSARFTWRGRLRHLEPNLGPHAIHGVTFDRPWAVEAVSRTSCRIAIALDERWPFGGRAVQSFELRDDGIDQRIEVHATSAPFPAGAGWHARFRRDVRPGRAVRLRVDASHYYETVEMIPTGWLKPSLGEHDLRRGEPLGDRRIDACYRAPAGELVIAWGDVELTMKQSPNVAHAVVYTPPEDVCVEPQTCAPDAFNLAAQGIEGAGVAIVEPGRPLVAETSWRWRIGGLTPERGRRRATGAVP